MPTGYEFEWNETKAKGNVRDHGVSFEEALTVFGDSFSILLPDPDHSEGEERFLVLGMSSRQRVLVVSHAERPPRTRLISARLATRRERGQYEDTK